MNVESIIKSAFSTVGYNISAREKHDRLVARSSEIDTLFELILESNGGSVGGSRAQLKQDILALIVNGFKRGGYFVEFGATNGRDLSNTYLLEKEYSWQGIIAEPMPRWHADLRKNRQCRIDDRCVWVVTGETLEFLDVENGEFSTIAAYANHDDHAAERKNSRKIAVETVSLNDLLADHRAPMVIDYLSVDTEGSEYMILKELDFNKYKFNFISVEYNFTAHREEIRSLLRANGYECILSGLSRFDDWFVPTA